MKKLSLLLASSMLALSSFASDVSVKLEGTFDFQAGGRKQKNLQSDANLTQNHKNGAFFSQSNLRVHAENESDYGMKYGAVVTVKTTSRTKTFPGMNGSYLFMESDYGKVELGSRQTAFSLLSQSAYNIAMGTGDDWFRYVTLNPNNAYNVTYSDYSFIYSGFGSSANSGSEQVRTATFYSPVFHGLQLGVSYSPDTANTGDNQDLNSGQGVNTMSLYDKDLALHEVKTSVKDLVGAGVKYNHNLGDGVDVTLGAGVEQGKTVAKENSTTLKLNNHKLYNVGAVVTYGNWSLAGSYADAGKSMTSTEYNWDKRKNRLYTGGLAYNQGPMGVSLTYLHNDKLKNKLDAYTLGTQYKVAPGLMPYFEVTSFKFRANGYKTSDLKLDVPAKNVDNRKVNGTAYMFGTRVSF